MKNSNQLIGKINSIETLGLLDGPGIRIVVFMQGCLLRCSYCHNPETWASNLAEAYTVDQLLEFILKYKTYLIATNGGVTFSGGEPLLQYDFLIEILKKCQANGIHTAIDTAGVGIEKEAEILKYTDLVILDIKHLDPKEYQQLTSYPIDKSLVFINLCQELNKPLWIRQVIIPGINDNADYINALHQFLNNYHNIKKVEFIPYHKLAIHKYDQLHLDYKLKDTKEMDKDRCQQLYQIFIGKNN